MGKLSDLKDEIKEKSLIKKTRKDSIILEERDGVQLIQETDFSPEIVDFLNRTTWGTQETLYQHKNTKDRIEALVDPLIIVLRIQGEIAATVVVDRRTVLSKGLKTKSYFFRYYASEVTFRNRRIVGLYSHRFMDRIRTHAEGKSVYYASIEKKNHRSLNINAKMGYQSIARIKTLGFSRFFPRRHRGVRRATAEDLLEIKDKLHIKYQDHSLYNQSYIGHNSGYYVLCKDGQIKAGLQLHHATWVVENLPGLMGDLLMKMGKYLPFFRRIFNPTNFKFIAIEGLYYQHQNVKDLLKLVEAVLAAEGVYSAVFWLDVAGEDYELLNANARKFGLLNRFVQDAELVINTSYRNLTKQEEHLVSSGPVYVSSFDFV